MFLGKTLFSVWHTPSPCKNCKLLQIAVGGKLTISVGGELQWLGFPPREVEIL